MGLIFDSVCSFHGTDSNDQMNETTGINTGKFDTAHTYSADENVKGI